MNSSQTTPSAPPLREFPPSYTESQKQAEALHQLHAQNPRNALGSAKRIVTSSNPNIEFSSTSTSSLRINAGIGQTISGVNNNMPKQAAPTTQYWPAHQQVIDQNMVQAMPGMVISMTQNASPHIEFSHSINISFTRR